MAKGFYGVLIIIAGGRRGAHLFLLHSVIDLTFYCNYIIISSSLSPLFHFAKIIHPNNPPASSHTKYATFYVHIDHPLTLTFHPPAPSTTPPKRTATTPSPSATATPARMNTRRPSRTSSPPGPTATTTSRP